MTTLEGFQATSLPAVQAATLAAITEQVPNLNANLKANYLTAFNNWLISWTAGRITDKSTAPSPPNGYVIGYFDDPTTGPGSKGPYGDTVVQWAYPAIGKEPVCAQPPIPTIPKAQAPVDPNAPPPGVLGCKCNAIDPALDGWPVGAAGRGTRADGSVWEKFVFHTPFGSGWYGECVVAATA